MRSIDDLNFKLDAEFFEEEFKLIEERSWFSDAKLLTALAGKGIKKGVMGAGDAIVGRLRNMIKNLSKPNGIYEQTFSDPEVQNAVYSDYLKDGDTGALNKLYNLRELKPGMDQTKILRESTLAKLSNPSFMQLYKLMDNYAADSMKKKRKEQEDLDAKATMVVDEMTDDEYKRIEENNKKALKYDDNKYVISEDDVVEYEALKKIVITKIEEKSKDLGIVDEQDIIDQEQADALRDYILLDLKSRFDDQGKVPTTNERFITLDQLVNEQNKMTEVENARKLKNKNMLDITEQELGYFININNLINKLIDDNKETLLINTDEEKYELSNSYLPAPYIIELQFLLDEPEIQTEIDKARTIFENDSTNRTDEDVELYNNIKEEQVIKAIKDNPDTFDFKDEKDAVTLADIYLKPLPPKEDTKREFKIKDTLLEDMKKANLIAEKNINDITEDDVIFYNEVSSKIDEEIDKNITSGTIPENEKIPLKNYLMPRPLPLVTAPAEPTEDEVGADFEQEFNEWMELQDKINEGTEGEPVDLEPLAEAVLESPKTKEEFLLSIEEIDELMKEADVTLPADVNPEAFKTEVQGIISNNLSNDDPTATENELISDSTKKDELFAEIIDELPDNMRSAIASEIELSDEQEAAIETEVEDAARVVVPDITDDELTSFKSEFFALPPSDFDTPSEDDILSSITVPEELKTEVGELIKSGEELPQDVYNQMNAIIDPTLEDGQFTDDTVEVFSNILPEGANEKAVATLLDAYLGAGYMGKEVDSKKMGDNIKKLTNEPEMPKAFYEALLQWLRNGFDDGWYGSHNTQEDLNIDNKDIKPGIISELSKNGIEVSEDEVDSLIEKFKKKDVEVQKENAKEMKETMAKLAALYGESVDVADEYLKLLEENMDSLKDEEERG